MRYFLNILLAIVLTMAGCTRSHAADRKYALQIMKRVFGYAASVDTVGLKAQESYAYLKYDIRTNKRNCLLLAIPTMYAIANTGVREHVGETYDRVVMKRPGDMRLTQMLERNTIPYGMRTMPTVLKYLTPLIYEELLIDGRIISPFHPRNRRFYRYKVSPFMRGAVIVSFRPRLKNTKLVRGWARIEESTGRILETSFDGEYDLVRFHVTMTTGDEGVKTLMPAQCNLNTRFLFLGNDITAEYTTVFDLPKKLPDSVKIVNRRDTALLNLVRPIPTNSHEQYLYSRYYAARDARQADTASQRSKTRMWTKLLWKNVGRRLVMRTRRKFGTHEQGNFRISPVLNPLSFSYSARRGLTYKFDIRGSYFFNERQALQLRFKTGYSFKQKQIYFDFPFTFYIDQRRNAYIRTEWSSGRHIYNSELMDAIRLERKDSIDWSRLNLTNFSVHSFKAVAHYDPSSHWGLELGIVSHKRTAVDNHSFNLLGRKDSYNSVAPIAELTYRPMGYNGPILTIDYERGIRKFMGSDTDYERVEIDGQYKHHLSALSYLQLRAGTGFYTHKGFGSYFLDYSNFRENNIPGGWNDDWACTFELLNSQWYNASKYYVRANAAYETPLLLLSWLPIAGRLIERERIYINALSVKRLNPYIEYGYGFSTRALSLGWFVAQRNWRFDGMGVRVNMELFRHW